MKWQPIETAPKDGTSILTTAGYGEASVRHWGEGEDDEMAWQPRIRGCFPERWTPIPADDSVDTDAKKPCKVHELYYEKTLKCRKCDRVIHPAEILTSFSGK